MGKSGVKGKKIGGMKVISMDKPKVKPAPAKKAKAAPIAAQQVDAQNGSRLAGQWPRHLVSFASPI